MFTHSTSLDCLISLAQVACLPGYVKPTFTDDGSLRITKGRHPMVEEVRTDPFVPNDVNLGGEEPKSMVITGTLASTQYDACPADEAPLGPNMVRCAVKRTLLGYLMPDSFSRAESLPVSE